MNEKGKENSILNIPRKRVITSNTWKGNSLVGDVVSLVGNSRFSEGSDSDARLLEAECILEFSSASEYSELIPRSSLSFL